MESIQKTVESAVLQNFAADSKNFVYSNYVSETVAGATSTASKEANKEQAKNSEAGVGTRLQAAGNAVSDKIDEQSHNTKAEANKQTM